MIRGIETCDITMSNWSTPRFKMIGSKKWQTLRYALKFLSKEKIFFNSLNFIILAAETSFKVRVILPIHEEFRAVVTAQRH